MVEETESEAEGIKEGVEGTEGTDEGTKKGVEGRKTVVEDATIDTESIEIEIDDEEDEEVDATIDTESIEIEIDDEKDEEVQDQPKIEKVPAVTSIYENQHLEILQNRLRRYDVDPIEQYVIISVKHSPNAELAFKEFFVLTSLVPDVPKYYMVNLKGRHWSSMMLVLTAADNMFYARYKDPLGDFSNFADKVQQLLSDVFGQRLNFAAHRSVDQIDNISCGPIAFNNIELMASHIHNLGLFDFLSAFPHFVFTTQAMNFDVRNRHTQNFNNAISSIHR